MSDIKELLDHAARTQAGPPSEETIEADLQRGRIAMARRRRRRVIAFPIAGTLGVAVLTGATLVATNAVSGDPTAAPGRSTPPSIQQAKETQSTNHAVRLVSYTGKQLDGFIVDQVPDGWYLQGSSAARLTIAPKGDKTIADNFIGKLVVMLQSADGPQALPDGEPVKVGTYDGVISSGTDTKLLTYQDDQGRFVEVQATDELGWSNQQLISFAEGVTVTADAVPGVG